MKKAPSATLIIFLLIYLNKNVVVLAENTNTVTNQSSIQLVKDSDLDGLSDEVELMRYETKIDNPDTDGDGILDAQEVLDRTDPTNPESNRLLDYKLSAQKLIAPNAPIAWYIGRIAGISAFIMFSLVICMGLLMTSKFLLKFRFLSAPNALEAHSFNATFIAFALLLIHMASFMFDSFINLSPLELLVPFLAKSGLISAVGQPIELPLAIGIIAFYLALVLIITSQFRKKLVPLKIWRAIHYTSFLFYATFLVHAFYSGTDSNEWWMKAIYIISASTIFSLMLVRIFGKKYFIASVTKQNKSPVHEISKQGQTQI